MLPQTQPQLSPCSSGADITVDFTVNVLAGGEGNLKLSTSLSKSSGQSTYWTLESTDYTMGSQYNPPSNQHNSTGLRVPLRCLCAEQFPAVQAPPDQLT
jgi:hypothetical protein